MKLEDISEEIYYIEELQGKLYIHGEKNVYLIDSCLTTAKEKLTDNFYYANPNVIVNNEKIVEYNYIDCILRFDNGQVIDKIIKKFNIC